MLPDPPQTPETEPFFAAAKEGRFLIRRCGACGEAHWYPRAICPFCQGDTAWEEASGEGTLHTFATMRRAKEPYTLAYVALAEGPVMMTNLVGADPDALAIGDAVRLAWRDTRGGWRVPCFEVVAAA